MSHLSVRSAVVAGLLLMLSVGLPGLAQDELPPVPEPDVRPPAPAHFAGLAIGPTLSPAFRSYERVLFDPPDGARLASGSTWEVGFDLAVALGKMDPGERWRAIRRNLGLAPDAKGDFLVWTEVVDDLLASLGTLPQSQKDGRGRPAFGLRVAFPGSAPAAEAAPDVALSFGAGKAGVEKEDEVITAMLRAVTGVEGLLILVDDDGRPVEGDWLSKYPGLTVHLTDAEGQEQASQKIKDLPYFHFSRLAGVPELGGDYFLTVSGRGGASVPVTEPRYVAIRPGLRTRQDLVLKLGEELAPPRTEGKMAEKSIEFGDSIATLAAAETSVQDAVSRITGSFPLLGPILSVLPANPGLHFGFIQTKDEGPQMFFSARFKLRAETHDRSPRFVGKGTIRFQVMTDSAGDGRPAVHYIKVVWCGQAAEADLLLANRPVSRFPLGLGIGVAPTLSPIMYSAGLSYKVTTGLEVYAGAGFRARSDDPEKTYARTSFVYGLTLDVQSVVDLIARAVGREDK